MPSAAAGDTRSLPTVTAVNEMIEQLFPGSNNTCDAIGVAPSEAIFLDDIGRNLKPARALGMTTIKVDDPEDALRELEALLDLPLLGDPPPRGVGGGSNPSNY